MTPLGPATASLTGRKVSVISRCAWTLFNFRLGLLERLQREGAAVQAYGAEDAYGERLAQAVDFRSIPVAKRSVNPVADARLVLTLIRELRSARPDVVHCFTIKPAIYATIAAWICAVPVRVVTITGLGHAFTTASGWLNRMVRLLYRFALSRAHLVYFQNAEDRDFFVRTRLVAAAKARLSPGSGIDTNKFAPVELPASRGAPPRFLMVARLIREKGITEFIEAAALVKQRYPHAQFAILGAEDSRNPSALTPAEVQGLRSSSVVNWLGETDDVRAHIAQSDVIVLPSYREGLPRSLLEGGAMARPLIATDTVGCRDVVVDKVTGYLVPVMDSAALAAAMCAFVEHPEQLQTLGAAARVRTVAMFDERLVMDATLEDYRRLLGQRVIDAVSATAA